MHVNYSNYGIRKKSRYLASFPQIKGTQKEAKFNLKKIIIIPSRLSKISQELTSHIFITTFKEIVTQALNFAVVVRVAHLLINLIAPLLDENRPSDIDLRISHVNFHI